jgi:hypothetical protein
MRFHRIVSALGRGFAVLALVLGTGFAAPALAADAPPMVVVQDPPPSGSMPPSPQYQIVTPTPGSGSVVVVTQPPSTGSGPSLPEYHVVVPGPNPAQNTGVGLGQQLSTPGNPVTVYPAR